MVATDSPISGADFSYFLAFRPWLVPRVGEHGHSDDALNPGTADRGLLCR